MIQPSIRCSRSNGYDYPCRLRAQSTYAMAPILCDELEAQDANRAPSLSIIPMTLAELRHSRIPLTLVHTPSESPACGQAQYFPEGKEKKLFRLLDPTQIEPHHTGMHPTVDHPSASPSTRSAVVSLQPRWLFSSVPCFLAELAHRSPASEDCAVNPTNSLPLTTSEDSYALGY